MVTRSAICAAILILLSGPTAEAQSPQDLMFPGGIRCYEREYGKGHLARHPEQRVTRITLMPDPISEAPRFAVDLRLGLRGNPAGAFEAHAICENNGASTLYCAMEGDAGGFQLTPAKNRSILLSVSSLGMSFENDAGFVMLERDSGDDRSFVLRQIPCR
jgi:hypothetical protein